MGMYKVAVTGGAASGKTSVCRRFEELGVRLIVSDQLAREVVEPGEDAYNKIVAHFGQGVVASGGGLDRMALRHRLTGDPDARRVIEQIVQPAIIDTIYKKMAAYEAQGCPVVVVEVPLLFELGMEGDFHLCVLVSVERELQLARLMERDKVTRDQAEALLAIQMEEGLKMERSHVVIENNGSLEQILAEADRVYEQIIKKKMS